MTFAVVSRTGVKEDYHMSNPPLFRQIRPSSMKRHTMMKRAVSNLQRWSDVATIANLAFPSSNLLGPKYEYHPYSLTYGNRAKKHTTHFNRRIL